MPEFDSLRKNGVACIKIEILFVCIHLVGAKKVQNGVCCKNQATFPVEAQICTIQEAEAL